MRLDSIIEASGFQLKSCNNIDQVEIYITPITDSTTLIKFISMDMLQEEITSVSHKISFKTVINPQYIFKYIFKTQKP